MRRQHGAAGRPRRCGDRHRLGAMDAFFKDREATIDKKRRLRAELRAAGREAGPRQMDPQQQRYGKRYAHGALPHALPQH